MPHFLADKQRIPFCVLRLAIKEYYIIGPILRTLLDLLDPPHFVCWNFQLSDYNQTINQPFYSGRKIYFGLGPGTHRRNTYTSYVTYANTNK